MQLMTRTLSNSRDSVSRAPHWFRGLVSLTEGQLHGLGQGWFSLRIIFLRTGTDRKVSFVLEPLVPNESSQDKGNFPVRSSPEENYPEWKQAFIGSKIHTSKKLKIVLIDFIRTKFVI